MQAGGLVRRLEDAQRIDVLARMTRPESKLAPPRRSVRALEPVSTKSLSHKPEHHEGGGEL